MQFSARTLVTVIGCACGLGFALPSDSEVGFDPAPMADSTTLLVQNLAKDRGPAIVTLKFVLQSEGEEQEQEATGIMISADGLVLASNLSFGGISQAFGGPAVSTKSLKVLVGDDQTGVDAKLISRDTELALVWIRTDAKPQSPYTYVDFANGAALATGETVFCVQRMHKFFDRAVKVDEARVSAVITKPRVMGVPTTGFLGHDLGMAIYNANGEPVAISTIVFPEGGEAEMKEFREVFADMQAGLLLPAKDVVEATKRALEAQEPGEPAASADAPATPADEPKQ